MPNIFKRFLERHGIEARQGQGEHQRNSALQHGESLLVGPVGIRGGASYGNGVRDAPMSSDRLTRPIGAGLLCGIVTDREHEIELRSSW